MADLQTDVVAKIGESTFFTETGRAVPVLPENKLDLVQVITNALSSLGACIIVSTPRLVEAERVAQVRASVLLSIIEFPLVNRATTGASTLKPAGEIAEQALGSLMGWTPDGEQWTPLEFMRMEEVGANADGQLLWELELRTHTHLGVNSNL